jgi:hypothetical protein
MWSKRLLCKRRGAGAALVWDNRETEMIDLAEIEALFFANKRSFRAGDVDLAGGPGARCRIGLQRSLAKSREVRHPLLWHLFSYCCDLGFIARKWEGRPCEDPIPCGPDPLPASR